MHKFHAKINFFFQFRYPLDEFLSDFRWHMCIGFVTALAVMPNVLSDAQVKKPSLKLHALNIEKGIWVHVKLGYTLNKVTLRKLKPISLP
jgi:hypothetical protein